jgi:hypothetical protein
MAELKLTADHAENAESRMQPILSAISAASAVGFCELEVLP